MHLPRDKIIYAWMYGWIPNRYPTDQRPISQDSLNNATLSISMYATLDDGEIYEPSPIAFPLRTTAFGRRDEGHLAIRDRKGKHVDYLAPGENDILTDCLLPSWAFKNGTFSFKFTARLGDQHDGGDGTCLFSITMTQWLEGKPFRR